MGNTKIPLLKTFFFFNKNFLFAGRVHQLHVTGYHDSGPASNYEASFFTKNYLSRCFELAVSWTKLETVTEPHFFGFRFDQQFGRSFNTFRVRKQKNPVVSFFSNNSFKKLTMFNSCSEIFHLSYRLSRRGQPLWSGAPLTSWSLSPSRSCGSVRCQGRCRYSGQRSSQSRSCSRGGGGRRRRRRKRRRRRGKRKKSKIRDMIRIFLIFFFSVSENL